MNRRHFLIQSSAVALSGCSAIGAASKSYHIEDFQVILDGNDTLSYQIEIVDDTINDESNGVFQFTVNNEIKQELYIQSGPNAPFGTVFAYPVSSGDSDGKILLWQDDFEAGSDGVWVNNDGSITVLPYIDWTRIPPRSSISEPFQIRHENTDLTEGTFRVSDGNLYSIGWENPHEPDGGAQYRVEFDIKSK